MTLFSRCDEPQPFGPVLRRGERRRAGARMVAALADLAEELGILFRYAAGLDYYGRDGRPRGR